MPVRVFTVPFDPGQGRFDDDAMVEALEGCRVLSLSDHAFTIDGTPVLALTVRFEPPPPPPGTASKPAAPRNRPQDALADVDQQLFEALRSWRNARAKKDGRPAYVLFTNAQLVEIATRRPATKAALQAIDGIGDARVDGYGDDVLAVVAKVPRGADAADAQHDA